MTGIAITHTPSLEFDQYLQQMADSGFKWVRVEAVPVSIDDATLFAELLDDRINDQQVTMAPEGIARLIEARDRVGAGIRKAMETSP